MPESCTLLLAPRLLNLIGVGADANAITRLGFGLALRLKNVSASGWSAVEAAEKQEPMITPEAWKRTRRLN